MKKTASFCMAVVFLMAFFGAVPTASAEQTVTLSVSGTYQYDFAFEVVKLVNIERAAENISPLTMDVKLLSAAMQRAAECVVYYDHTRPNGQKCFTVIPEYGASYGTAGENIAGGQTTPEQVVASWMDSPGHRANIMNASFTAIGVGCFYQAGGRLSWSQVFTNRVEQEASSDRFSGTVDGEPNVVVSESYLGTPTLNASALSMSLNQQTTLSFVVQNAGWDRASFTPSPASLTFVSDNSAVAAVDQNGVVDAVGGGTATITAWLKDFPTCTASVTVSVRDPHVSDWAELQSEHPYANNTDNWWIYTADGYDVCALEFTFSEQTELETMYDFVYIYDKNDRLIGQYTGQQLAGQTFTIAGNTVKLRLVSDYSNTKWGFSVTDLVTRRFVMNDVLYFFKYLSGQVTLTDSQKILFDVNMDDQTDIRDMLELYAAFSGAAH